MHWEKNFTYSVYKYGHKHIFVLVATNSIFQSTSLHYLGMRHYLGHDLSVVFSTTVAVYNLSL